MVLPARTSLEAPGGEMRMNIDAAYASLSLVAGGQQVVASTGKEAAGLHD